jgi:hypothetical protein
MNAKIVILFVLIGACLVGWAIFGFQRLTVPQTTMAEIQRAFPADSYQVYQKGDKVTLYALKPETAAENFRGYGVVGKTEIQNIQHQTELKVAFIRGMGQAVSKDCFNPRHGLRVEANEKTVDLVISFECGKFAVLMDDQKGEGAVSAADLESPFNQILKNAGIETTK